MFYDSDLTDYKLQFKYGSLLNLKTLEQLETEGLKYTPRKDKSKQHQYREIKDSFEAKNEFLWKKLSNKIIEMPSDTVKFLITKYNEEYEQPLKI